MTINQALQWGIEQLKKVKIDSPELDAELLLTYALEKEKTSSRFGAIAPKREEGMRMGGIERAWMYAHQEQKLTNPQLKAYQLFIKRRVQREPVAYILGHKEFYGLDFEVNTNVLIPRPETELLVDETIKELVKCQMSNVRCVAVDVGTGSGAIVVALANESGIMNPSNLAGRQESGIRFFAIDNSLAVLKVARKNARKYGVVDRIKFLRGNLLEPIIHNFAIASRHIPINKFNAVGIPHQWSGQSRNLIILANLPYGFSGEYKKLQPEITKYEPRAAVDGGKDGLKYYRQLFRQINRFVTSYKLQVISFCEIDPRQTINFKKLARQYFPKANIELIKDLAGKNRVAKINF